MKLYSTITSERATKGQGGNKFLNIKIASGSAKNSYIFADIMVDTHGFIYLRNGDKGEVATYTTLEGKLVELTKGEKQKGEMFNRLKTTPQEVIDEYNKLKHLKGEKQKGEKICKLCDKQVYRELNYCWEHRPNL